MNVSRRAVLKAGVATGAMVALGPAFTQGEVQDYPLQKIGNTGELTEGEAVYFTYPDEQSQGILVKLGREATAGVGPERDIVAFSAACTHMGCGVQYRGAFRLPLSPLDVRPRRQRVGLSGASDLVPAADRLASRRQWRYLRRLCRGTRLGTHGQPC